VRKNGRMVSPDAVASWSTKLVKSTAVILSPNGPAASGGLYRGAQRRNAELERDKP
jgi:hypothetical protein